jgi:hypothetical protein
MIDGALSHEYLISSLSNSDVGEYYAHVSGTCGEVNSNKTSLSLLTDLKELQKAGINIYPNPNNGRFVIESKNISDFMSVKLHDLTGKLMLHKTYYEPVNKIDIPTALPGIYLLEINLDGNYINTKLIIK